MTDWLRQIPKGRRCSHPVNLGLALSFVLCNSMSSLYLHPSPVTEAGSYFLHIVAEMNQR